MPSGFACRNIERFASDIVLRRGAPLWITDRSRAGRTVSDNFSGLPYSGFSHAPIGAPTAVAEDGPVISATKGARHDIT